MPLSRENIIQDLLRIQPRGDYAPTELFELELHSRFDCERAVFAMFYERKHKYAFQIKGADKGHLKRRTDRLWNVLEHPVREVQRTGGPGVYSISVHYEKVGYVWADSIAHAEQLAVTLYGYLTDDPGSRLALNRINIVYIRACDQPTGDRVMMPIKAELLSYAQRNRQDALKMIRTYEAKLRTAEMIIDTLGGCKTEDSMV